MLQFEEASQSGPMPVNVPHFTQETSGNTFTVDLCKIVNSTHVQRQCLHKYHPLERELEGNVAQSDAQSL